MNIKYIEILKNSYLFSDIKDEEIKNMLPCLSVREKNFKKGETILAIGDKSEEIGVVVKGSAHIVQEDYWGRKIIISELHNSDVFGEVFATLRKKSEVNIQAIKDSTILFLNISKVITICSHTCSYHNKLVQNLLISIAEKNLKMTQKINCMGKKSIREKLLTYLSTQSIKTGKNKFKIPFNRQDLADYLSVDRSALSNEISKLKKEGQIKVEKNEFEINILKNKTTI